MSKAPVLHPNVVLPAVTTLLGVSFVAILIQRFMRRRQPYLLVWAFGLLWYALAAGSEGVGGAVGWSPALYRIWYVTGAIGVAAYLGAGTLYLHRDPPFGSLTVICVLGGSVPALATNHLDIGFLGLGTAILLTAVLTAQPKNFPHAVLAVLILASLAAAYRITEAPVDVTQLPSTADQIVSGQAFDGNTRALTPPFNIAGALVLILGALLSTVQYWRTRALSSRVTSSILIAVGAFVPSVASGLTRFGYTSAFFLGELLGMLCILAGFMLSGSASARPTSGPSASSGPS